MNTDQVIGLIAASRYKLPSNRGLLVAVSGIDGSGKSTITGKIVERLESMGMRSALIGLDAWHNPPEKRFCDDNPARHFYDHAFRFDELFETLIDPLVKGRSLHKKIQLTRLPQNDFYVHSFDLDDIDVIILEGIFLFKKALIGKYDLSFWVECSFETALRRAILRNQEGLAEDEIIRDYDKIYFPAQRIHFAADEPASCVNGVVSNE
ncbi:MAG: uridine kinase [Pyrinomonadaceae bacterium]